MAGLPFPFHFLMLVIGSALQGPRPVLGYNIDTSPATIFSSNTSVQFGYEVLQIGEGPEARIIVGAPGEQNTTGHVYQCKMQNEECQDIPLEGGSGVSHLGMTLASNFQRSKMIACGPGVAQHCDKNLFVSGICYLFDAKLHKLKNITTGYQKCLKGDVDLVFLFDGSESLRSKEFNQTVEFMIDVMEKLRNTTIRFAAVQFSYDISIEFDFNNYTNNPNPRNLLANVEHKKSITNTFKAIKYVVEKVFIPERGTRAGANRVMVIITDGDATDTDSGSVQAAKDKKILRFIIGIGSYFPKNVSQARVTKIASEPISAFVKVLKSFEELKDSFNELQSKIYDIEDTSDSNNRSFYLEVSSSGFSAEISKGRVVLGAVGANDWAGGLLEQQEGLASEKFITAPMTKDEMKAAYLGYALKFLQHQKRELYAVGAPRYQHVGRVLVFEVNLNTTDWMLKQQIRGEQIGSYFGAVLCSVDVDGDGETDLLLIGAQLHFKDMRGGRVYVYTWAQDNLALLGELQGDAGDPLGRFGAAIADLADISGDGLTDVAVGAPLEDGESGVVYIYNGYEKTLRMSYSQKIKGANISPGLKFFGRSIHGKTDLSEDGLTDITVGALGKAVVLRSKPIVTVGATVRFWPENIPVKEVECLGDPGSLQAVEITLTVCFNVSLATEHYQGHLSANLSFSLEIDRNRMKNRGVFRNGKKVLEGTRSVSVGSVCFQENMRIPTCIEDYISSIVLSVDFSLNDDPNKGDLSPVLNPLSNRTTVEIPFEKNCGDDAVCEADLRLLFRVSGNEKLLLSPAFVLSVDLELKNLQEDAYHTVLYVLHIPGLSFRKASVRESSATTMVSCHGIPGEGQGFKKLACNVSHPIYREQTYALIELKFDVLENSSLDDSVEMKAYVSSDNEKNETLSDNVAALRIPVQYPINVIVKGLETSIQYINFSSVHQENKTVMHLYEVKNVPLGAFPPAAVTVFVKVPTTFPAGLTWDVDSVQAEPSVKCEIIQLGNSTEKTNFTKHHPQLMEQCAVKKYHVYQCSLGQINSCVISVTGTVYSTIKIEQFSQSSFCTASWLTFDTRRYFSQYDKYAQSQVTTKVDMIYVMDYLPIIIGSAVGGLFLLILIIVGLYKCGFFKRNYKDKMDQEGETETAFPAGGNSEDDEGKAVPLNGEAESK